MLADDHRIFCDGIANLLNQTGQFEVNHKYHDGSVLLKEFVAGKADLILLDVELPGMNGLDLIKRIRLADPAIRIVMLTMHEESTYAIQAFREGADGYLSKTIAGDELIAMLLQVIAGTAPRYLQKARPEEAVRLLSHKEQEVLKLIAAGKTNTEISEVLNISSLTVKTHRQNIMRKLGVNNTAALIRKGFSRGLL